ncbi:MAG: GNAT family N-acetyltransferase [Bryobacteraceae bacterium]
MNQEMISEMRQEDQRRWKELWRGYLDFYQTTLPDEVYERTWARLMDKSGTLRGFCARHPSSGTALGIVHFLLHESAWTDRPICYLQDLFVAPEARGQGHGRDLIEAVAEEARQLNCARLYWLTQENNSTARQLYDRLAAYQGFIRYDYKL